MTILVHWLVWGSLIVPGRCLWPSRASSDHSWGPHSLYCSAGTILKFLISEHRAFILILYCVTKLYSRLCPHLWKFDLYTHSANSHINTPVPELGAGDATGSRSRHDPPGKELTADRSGLLQPSRGGGNVLGLLRKQSGKKVHRVDWLHFYKINRIFIVFLTGRGIISASIFQTSEFETK